MFVHLHYALRDLRARLRHAEVILVPTGADTLPKAYVPIIQDGSTPLLRLLRWFLPPDDLVVIEGELYASYRGAARLIVRLLVRTRARHLERTRARQDADRRQRSESEDAERDRAIETASPEAQDERDPREDRVRWSVVDMVALRDCLASLGPKEARRAPLIQLASRSVRRLPMTTDDHVEAARRLEDRFPNFGPAIEQIVRHLVLRARLDLPLSLPRLLLDGPPGIGKTRFVGELAKELGFCWRAFSFAELTAGFMLTGSTSQWSSGSTGLIAKLILDTPADQVPLLLGDEVDKALKSSNYPTAASLIGMLEPVTAERFVDEYLGVAMDIRPLSMMMTCNQLNQVRPEIRSRVSVVSIPPPSLEQMPAIVRSVDTGVRASLPGLDDLFEPLDETFVRAVTALPPRDLGKLLEEAYARAAAVHQKRPEWIRLTPEHLNLPRAPARQSSTPPVSVTEMDSRELVMAARLLNWLPSTKH